MNENKGSEKSSLKKNTSNAERVHFRTAAAKQLYDEKRSAESAVNNSAVNNTSAVSANNGSADNSKNTVSAVNPYM